METLDHLKEIVKNAPEGGHEDSEIFYSNTANGNYILFFEDDFYLWDGCWVKYNYKDGYWMLAGMRSLSDIKLIIELMELNQNMHTTVAGYLWGKDWAHWNEFNAGKFKL